MIRFPTTLAQQNTAHDSLPGIALHKSFAVGRLCLWAMALLGGFSLSLFTWLVAAREMPHAAGLGGDLAAMCVSVLPLLGTYTLARMAVLVLSEIERLLS